MENRNGFRARRFAVKILEARLARNDDNASSGPHCAMGGFLLRTLPVWRRIQAESAQRLHVFSQFSQIPGLEMRPEPPGTI